MGKPIYFVIFLCLMFFVVGCNQESIVEWHDSKEAAIEAGIKQEEVEWDSVLSIEEFEGETFVFYEYKGGLGVANIVESEEGYGWIRNQPYFDFEVYGGDLSYSTSGFEVETETGFVASVLIGKTFDSSIKEMKFWGDGTERKLKVLGENRFFFALHNIPFDNIDISPIFN